MIAIRSEDYEKYAPWGNLPRRKKLPLLLQDLRPTIRIVNNQKLTDFQFQSQRIIFDYLFMYFRKAQGFCEIDGEKIEVKDNYLILIPPFHPHIYRLTGITDQLAIHFDWKQEFPPLSTHKSLRRDPYEIKLPAITLPQLYILKAYDPVIPLFQQIAAEYGSGDVAKLRADVHLFEVIGHLLERSQTRNESLPRHDHANEARVEIAIKLMQDKLAQKITCEDLARATGLSYSYFARIFHKQAGYPPLEYLNHLRIQKGMELLADIHLSVKEVATLCGFEDPFYFTKVFTHLQGKSPSRYREDLLANPGSQKSHRMSDFR